MVGLMNMYDINDCIIHILLFVNNHFLKAFGLIDNLAALILFLYDDQRFKLLKPGSRISYHF